MSYEDLEVVRENRAAKNKVTAAGKGKGKDSRKRQCAAPEADVAEPNAKAVRTSTVCRAPMARMY
jgi:hypothetical protein